MMIRSLVLPLSLLLGFVAVANNAHAAKPETISPAARPPVILPPVARAPERAPVFIKAPEIDATAGVQAIALLSGMLLLVAERTRRRRG